MPPPFSAKRDEPWCRVFPELQLGAINGSFDVSCTYLISDQYNNIE
jgi:hypothetical protein